MQAFFCVGAARFELATSWSQTRRDDRTTLRPELLFKDANVRKFIVDAILFLNKCLWFDFQGAVYFAAALLSLSTAPLFSLRSFFAAALLSLRSLLAAALITATPLLHSFLAAALLTATSLLHNRLRRLCNLLRRLMQLRCGCLSFFAFFSDLSFLQLRCSRSAVFGICCAAPSSTAALFSGLAPLRYADPFGTFGGSSFKPKQRSCLGAFCLKKTF